MREIDVFSARKLTICVSKVECKGISLGERVRALGSIWKVKDIWEDLDYTFPDDEELSLITLHAPVSINEIISEVLALYKRESETGKINRTLEEEENIQFLKKISEDLSSFSYGYTQLPFLLLKPERTPEEQEAIENLCFDYTDELYAEGEND